MKISSVNNLQDSTGEIVLCYPISTLLDNILLDLWGNINKYRYSNQQIFIGRYGKTYNGFIAVEYWTFKQNLFKKMYIDANGLLLLDDCMDNNYL